MNKRPAQIFALALLMGLGAPAGATKETEPGQQTVWDQLMEAQSYRELQAGSQHMQERDYDKAVKEFAKAVIKQPKDPVAHLMLGTAYYWTGQVDQAQAEFDEALKLDPKSDQGHLLMGIARAYRGETQAAYASFSEAERLNGNRADIQMDLGSIEESMEMYPKALDHFRKAVALESNNPLYHFQLGTLYGRLGRDMDAVESLKLAIKNYPEFEDAVLELGAALERLGRPREAMEMFSKAVKLKPRDSVARLRLARVYLLLGDSNKAREASRDAFHLTPDEPGGGLALSVSFGGKPKEDSAGASSAGKAERAPQAQEQEPRDHLDVLARNLERIPLGQEAKLSIEMAFLPRPKLERERTREFHSSLKRALEEAGKAPRAPGGYPPSAAGKDVRPLPAAGSAAFPAASTAYGEQGATPLSQYPADMPAGYPQPAPPRPNPMGIKREFTLPASNIADRQAKIKKLLEDLRQAMRQAPPDAETRMAMNLSFNDAGPVAGRPAGDSAGQPKVSYQPRQVGNDLGLWVQGTGWMSLVEEVLPEPGEAPTHPQNSDWWVNDGLGHAALGNGGMALDAFSRALEFDPKNEVALLGRSVALVELGRENEAVAAYRRLLDIYPKNKTAKEGLAWLMRAPVSSAPTGTMRSAPRER